MPPSPFDRDRRVHGRTTDGGEIVRYDRAGKWYVEYPASSLKPRRKVAVLEAAALARDGEAFLGNLGGGRFDAAVRGV